MNRPAEITAAASITAGFLAAILRLGLFGALLLGLIVGCTMSLIVVRRSGRRVGAVSLVRRLAVSSASIRVGSSLRP